MPFCTPTTTEIEVDDNTFLLYPLPPPKKSFEIWFQAKKGNPVMLGVSSSDKERNFLIKNYFRFSFCLLIDQEGVYLPTIGDKQPWHIRPLIDEKRYIFSTKANTIDTESLCKKVQKKNGVDIIAPVNLLYDNICEDCLLTYAFQQSCILQDEITGLCSREERKK